MSLPADVTGYDARFLAQPIALPTVSDGRKTTTLAYPRFSVTLDAERRLAAVTAVNIDGDTLLDLPRRGDWRLDDRIPADAQAGPAVYADNDLDRGHLVRRRDPGWGSRTEAHTAMAATFFYPNAAPQAAAFNQSKDLWLGLEDHVLAYAEAERHRISVFTAPVRGADDPPYRGIRIPLRFWKVVAWSTGSELAAAAFVLDQSDLVDAAQRIGVTPIGEYRTFQVPIAEVERIAAVDLGPLAAADVPATRAARGAAGWRALQSTADIRLA